MNSTDFGALVSPTITAMDRRSGYARGGEAKKPRPVMGALAQALMRRPAVKPAQKRR